MKTTIIAIIFIIAVASAAKNHYNLVSCRDRENEYYSYATKAHQAMDSMTNTMSMSSSVVRDYTKIFDQALYDPAFQERFVQDLARAHRRTMELKQSYAVSRGKVEEARQESLSLYTYGK